MRIEPFEPLTEAERARNLAETCGDHRDDVWLFAYGSLVWNPGFRPAESRRATLWGYRRSFCVWSVLARGSPERPGLGLGLVRSEAASCEGVAMRIVADQVSQILPKIWLREMWTDAYRPAWCVLRSDRGEVRALTFVTNTESRQFAGLLSEERIARYIADAHGEKGSNRAYLRETVVGLQSYGIGCVVLEALERAILRTDR